jgi:putative tryptophan/tyrosine transport system substrate-binding protein
MDMRRRDFMALLGGSAVAWPFAARAQQPAMPVIAFLSGQFASQVAPFVAAFREGLKSAGYVEGENVLIVFRYADSQRDKLPAIVADLARDGPAVIVATGGTPVTLAAKAAASTIPIVFAIGGDPVALGVVANLNRPGGNATGACYFFNTLGPKRLEILHELVPKAKVIGYLANPTNPSLESESREMQNAARALGLDVRVQKASNQREIDLAFASFAQECVDAVISAADVMFTIRRDQVVSLAARHALPASYHSREIPEVGGLTSYGPSQAQAYRQAGIYTGRILKGEKPGDLPVVQATKFELIFNLKTAKAIGLEIPPTLLARADEVIE